MKLRITQKGFENYSGQMGMILFKDGVSVYDVKERDALRLSALFNVTWETGEYVKVTKVEVEPTAPVGRETYLAPTDGKPEEVGGNDGSVQYVESTIVDSEVPVKIVKRYTLDELEAIADQEGINGLRKIAGPMGIRGTSINGLIEQIMSVAGEEKAMPEGVEVVEG